MENTVVPGFHTIDARIGPCNLTFAFEGLRPAR